MEFIVQPAQSNRLGEYLNDNFAANWTHFRAAVAFVKRSGTQHIDSGLAAFAASHDVEIIAGIDHQGTSYEGLQSLLDSVSPSGRIIVFHNPGFLTFHPKVYLFKSSSAADIVIGSGNLTQGGLYSNYEAGLRLRLDLADPDQAATLQHIENVLDQWNDTTTGTALLLSSTLLAQLVAQGLAPPEALHASTTEARKQTQIGLRDDRGAMPFTVRAEPSAPVPPRLQGSLPTTPARALGQLAAPIGFLMTLQKTDVGVGQTTPGTSRRSPEIFIPLTARNAHPGFWKWPYGFVTDPNPPHKKDRQGVKMRLGGGIISVNMMTWPARHDFRLRNEALRNAGQAGDILRIERSIEPNASYEYYVEIIPQGTSQYPIYSALCMRPVPNSPRRFGYY